MEEPENLGAPEVKSRAEANLHRSVLILAVALTLVVVLSVRLFEKETSDDLAMHSANAPRDRAGELLRQGWNVFHQLEDRDQAEQLFREALRISPRNPMALDACGQMALMREDFQQALVHFEDFYRISAQSPRSCTSLAICMLCLERTSEAESLGLKVLENANDADLQFQANLILACTYQKMGKDTKAQDYLRSAVGEDRGAQVERIARRQKWAAPILEIQGSDLLLKGGAPQPEVAPEQ